MGDEKTDAKSDDSSGEEKKTPAPPISLGIKILGSLVAIPFVLFLGFLLVSCLSARSAAHTFVDAVHDHRLDDARAMLSAELQQRLKAEDFTTATGEPTHSLALLWTAKNVTWSGLVQSGFSDVLIPFGCFDGEADGKTFWLVIWKREARWQITDVRMTKPEVCEGPVE